MFSLPESVLDFMAHSRQATTNLWALYSPVVWQNWHLMLKERGRPELNVSESSQETTGEATATSKDSSSSLLLWIVMNYLYEDDPGAGIALALRLSLPKELMKPLFGMLEPHSSDTFSKALLRFLSSAIAGKKKGV